MIVRSGVERLLMLLTDEFFISKGGILIKSKLFEITSWLSEISSQLGSLIKYMPHYYGQRLDEITHIFEAENELAKVSSMNFVCAIRPVLRELSCTRIEPFSIVYKKYLEEVMCKILEGKDLPDILDMYDVKLLEMRGNNK